MVRSRFLHYAVCSGLLFGFSYYILYLERHDTLVYYIAPGMAAYVQWSAVGFCAMAAYQAYLAVAAIRNREWADCSCEDLPPFRLKAVLIYGVFAVPLILGFSGP